MRAHTRKHPIKQKDVSFRNHKDTPMFTEEAIRLLRGSDAQAASMLKGLRYREDLTQRELGDMLGIKQTNISLMEHGKRPIGKNLAKRLAELFKIDYRLFL